jgi:hypothetical protein
MAMLQTVVSVGEIDYQEIFPTGWCATTPDALSYPKGSFEQTDHPSLCLRCIPTYPPLTQAKAHEESIEAVSMIQLSVLSLPFPKV